MNKFKVGDKVKLIKHSDSTCGFEIGNVYKITEFDNCDNLNIHIMNAKIGLAGWVNEEHIEKVESPIVTIELKKDTNGITIEKKKEGNEMIESMNLIDLYASKHKESIEKKVKEKVEELRKNCDVINRYNELCEQFKKDCDELYLSQFAEEEKMDIIADKLIGDADKQLQRGYGTFNKYKVNYSFNPEGYEEKVETPYREKMEKLDDLVKTVKAHVGIAKTKEEVEEILTRYGIIDKKGKLVTE